MQQLASQEPGTGARSATPPRPPDGTCQECGCGVEPVLIPSQVMGDRWVGPAKICELCAGRAERSADNEERLEKYRELLAKSEVPADALGWTFSRAALAAPKLKSGEDLAGYQRAWQECKSWHGHQGMLLLRGPTGTGKTALAVCGFKIWLWDKGQSGLFISAPELNAALASKGQPRQRARARELLGLARSAGLVLLDDLAVGRMVAPTQRGLAGLIEHRRGKRLPMLITTNATDMQIAQRFRRQDPHGRLADRLTDVRLCREVPVLGRSFRRLGGVE